MEDPEGLDCTSKEVAAEAIFTVPAHSAEELVAKSIAPVKREYLRPPPVRSGDIKAEEKVVQNDGPAAAPILKEKKSKRQLKRERREVRNYVDSF